MAAVNQVQDSSPPGDESRWRRELERLELVMRGSNDGIWDWDLRPGGSAWFSAQFCALLGYAPEQLPPAASTWNGLPHPEDRERSRAALEAHLAQRGPYDVEMRLLTAHGNYRWFRALGQAVWDAEGRPLRLVGSIRDITARKELERTLRERSAELAVARDAAERANEAKSRFLAAASHDLRQPLQTMGLLHAILARIVHEPEPAAHLRSLGEAIHTMENLLGALLDVHRLESGVISPTIREFALDDLLARLRADLAYAAQSKQLGLEIAGTGLRTRSDPHLLEIVLRNLLSNAIKYTLHGGVKLAVEVSGRRLRIDVTDTGIGIPPQHLQRIFDEFYQVDNPTRDRRRGIGLGLAIVQRLSLLLDHPVTVTSTPGQGSTFSVSVPLAAAGARDAGAAHPQAAGRRGRHAHRRRGADPRRTAGAAHRGRCVRRRFARPGTGDGRLRGRARRQCRGGPARRARARAAPGSRDHGLPAALGATGADVVRQLRAELGARVPAVLLTGDQSPARDRHAAGVVDSVLEKPVDAAELLRRIAQLVAPGERGTPA
ncbi:MAG: ATP-binding protein [Steroidobacteraceae bacterium]